MCTEIYLLQMTLLNTLQLQFLRASPREQWIFPLSQLPNHSFGGRGVEGQLTRYTVMLVGGTHLK